MVVLVKLAGLPRLAQWWVERGRGKKFPGGASSLGGLGLGLKFPGGTCLGEAKLATSLRDLLGLRDLNGGVYESERHHHGDQQAPQPQAVSTAAVA